MYNNNFKNGVLEQPVQHGDTNGIREDPLGSLDLWNNPFSISEPRPLEQLVQHEDTSGIGWDLLRA